MTINHAAPGGQHVITCKGCNGWAPRNRKGGNPPGWYGLTAAVPEEISTYPGRGYVWVGSFCCVACLAAAIPDLERQEELAHLAYEPVRPVAS
jgi:hypothetical protein